MSTTNPVGYTPSSALPTSSLQASQEIQDIRAALSAGGNVNLAALTVRLGNMTINTMSDQVKTMMTELTTTAAKLDTANKLNASLAAFTADRTNNKMADGSQFGPGSAQLIADIKSVPGILTDAEIKKYETQTTYNPTTDGAKEIGKTGLIKGNGLTNTDIDTLKLKIKTFQDAASTQSQTFNMEINQKNNQINQMTSLITTMAQVLNQANKTAAGG